MLPVDVAKLEQAIPIGLVPGVGGKFADKTPWLTLPRQVRERISADLSGPLHGFSLQEVAALIQKHRLFLFPTVAAQEAAIASFPPLDAPPPPALAKVTEEAEAHAVAFLSAELEKAATAAAAAPPAEVLMSRANREAMDSSDASSNSPHRRHLRPPPASADGSVVVGGIPTVFGARHSTPPPSSVATDEALFASIKRLQNLALYLDGVTDGPQRQNAAELEMRVAYGLVSQLQEDWGGVAEHNASQTGDKAEGLVTLAAEAMGMMEEALGVMEAWHSPRNLDSPEPVH